MSMEKQAKLVRLLLKKTKVGQIDWKESAMGGDAFQVSFRDNSVIIGRAGPGGRDVVVSLVNENGDLVETFNDDELRARSGDRDSAAVFELHELARRTALGSEKVLNSILNELGDDDDIPF